MKIGIEAQRIFRKNKHGMDYVVLQEIKELQQMDTTNEYYVFVKILKRFFFLKKWVCFMENIMCCMALFRQWRGSALMISTSGS